MAFNAGKIFASLNLNIAPFIKSVGQSVTHIKQMGNAISNSFTPLNNLNTKAQQVNNTFRDMDRIIGGILISQAFYQGASAISTATIALGKFMNDMDRANISMEYFLNSSERAKGFILVMKDFAATTAFSTEQALELSKRLLGANFKPENIKSVMTILNDTATASGTSADELDRIVLAMTQIKNQGKLMATELRQFANANIPIYRILKEELKLTGDQMANIGDLDIPADKAIAALLTGLEKEYKGAAARMAQTAGGMWETIKDDSLIVGESIMAVPFKKYKELIKSVRDSLEDARAVVTKSGAGGLFEKVVPKDLQQPIKVIVGSVLSMVDSVKMLGTALKPVATQIMGTFIKVFATAGPIIASVVRTVSSLVSTVLNASPAIRMLAAAIGTLLIANFAAKALALLWSVVRLGALCAVIAKTVRALYVSISILMAVTSPAVLAIIAAAAALAYFALTSKTASAWLDRLLGKLSEFAGINIKDMFKPADDKDLASWIDEFSKSLEGVGGLGDAMDETGKKAKKMKDKFTASFDELYQIPDELDDVGDSLDNIGEGMDDIPKLPQIPTIDPPDITTPDFDLDLPDNLFPPAKYKPPTLPPPDVEPTKSVFTKLVDWTEAKLEKIGLSFKVFSENAAGAMAVPVTPILAQTVAINTLGESITKLGEKIKVFGADSAGAFETAIPVVPIAEQTAAVNTLGESVTALGEKIKVFGAESAGAFATAVPVEPIGVQDRIVNTLGESVVKLKEKIKLLGSETVGAFATAVPVEPIVAQTGVVNTIGESVVKLSERIKTFGAESAVAIGTFTETTVPVMNTWDANTSSLIDNWSSINASTMSKWGTDAAKSVGTWADTTESKVGTWDKNVSTNLGTWSTVNGETLKKWGEDNLKPIDTWAGETEVRVGTWDKNISTNLDTWSSVNSSTMGNWAKDNAKTIDSWTSGTSGSMLNWGNNTGSNLATWANTGVDTLNTFVTNSAESIGNWGVGTSTNIAEWVNVNLANLLSFGQSAGAIFSVFAKVGFEALGSFLEGSSTNVNNWASNVAGRFASWAIRMWTIMKALAGALGEKIGDFTGAAVDGLGAAYKATASWVDKNQGWIIPVAVGAAVAGTAIAIAASGGAAAPVLLPALARGAVMAFERGGVVDKDQLIRAGEKNHKEAIIPLENTGYMRPFSSAIANDLLEMMGDSGSFGGGSQQVADIRQIMYVGTLIADERSLKELERKLDVIRVSEDQRRGE